VEHQIASCAYHTDSDRSTSILVDHSCSKSVGRGGGVADGGADPPIRQTVPSLALHVLEAHNDEVWHVAFSHDGRFLVSASKDATIAIYACEKVRVVVRFFLRVLTGR
jgi:WD repeat-containing protein 26